MKKTLKNRLNLPDFLVRLNYLPVFDPSLWPKRELISRIAAILIVAAFLFMKFYHFGRFPGSFDSINDFYLSLNKKFSENLFSAYEISFVWGIRVATWMIETGILLGYIFVYLIRARAIGVAKGFMEVVFPFIIAGTPLLISLTTYNLHEIIHYDSIHYVQYYLGVMGLILAGGTINFIGLLNLRRSFALMSEARMLITAGIYKFLRHPFYTGHFIMFFGSLCMRLHSYTIAMYLFFVVGQVFRARIEERKLLDTFPEYSEYMEKTGMFFPKLFR